MQRRQPGRARRCQQLLLVALAPQLAQARYGHEALGDTGGQADTRQRARVRVAQEARVPLGVVLRVGAVERLQLPPLGEEQQQPCARAAAPARRRSGRLPRTRSGRPRSSTRSGAPQLAGGPHSSATMNSMTPLGALRSRRIRSSEMPSVPHGTNDSSAISLPSRRTPRPAGSRRPPGRRAGPSAIEKPRSVSVSRQASARWMICCHLLVGQGRSGGGAGSVAPVRSTRLTAWRVTRMSRPSRSNLVTCRIASSPSSSAPDRAREGLGALLAGTHDGRRPGVRRPRQPRLDAGSHASGSPTGSPLARQTPASTR